MSVHLITGTAGFEHVTSADHGALHAAIMGGGEFVLEGGEQFTCQVISNNKVRIFDGEALMQGRHIRIDRNTYEETTHDNGVQGYKRIDLIVFTYTKNETTGVENVTLDVIKGIPSEGTPEVPAYETGDILNNGESKNQMPLYKIPFDGLSIGEPEAMFFTVPTLETMKKEVDAEVEAKKTELDKKFATLEDSIDEKIAEAGKPLASDADDWALIEKYGEYSADAKTVGEELASTNGRIDTLNTNMNSKAPKSHASAGTTYGVGNASNYGHVKLSDTYASKVNSGAAANGVGASQNALYNAYNALNSSLNSMGGYDLIGTYATPQVIEIDLSKYKSVSMITTHTGGYHYQPVTIPVDLLKTSTTNLWQIYFSAGGNEYYATFKYVDDTHIQLTRMNGFVNAMFLGYK
jgi:hypothetical protein